MPHFARIAFWLDKYNTFKNLSTSSIQLFAHDGAICTAHIDSGLNRPKVIVEFGPFSTKEDAARSGIHLVRLIKLEMIKREFIIDISSRAGELDTSDISVKYGGLSSWEKFCDYYKQECGQSPPDQHIIENECIGLGVYEIEKSLGEITFVSATARGQISQDFSLQHETLAYWDETMDTALSLLSSSTGVNDVRIKFLMRLMAIEALASPSRLRDSEYLAFLDSMTNIAEQSDTKPEYKKTFKSQLGMFKEKSISQKANELFAEYLPEKTYMGLSPKEFFAQCYRLRSGFVHTGSVSGVDSNKTQMLKSMTLDLLYAMSKRAK